MDHHARKQVLLARIAHERVELRRDVARVGEAASWTRLLRDVLGGGPGAPLFGAGAGNVAGWLGIARALLSRYRLVGALFGAGAAVLRGRSGAWRRVTRLGLIGAAAWLGWRVVQGRGRSERHAARR
ncbi:MAG: hypothetical protein ABI671_15850 [Burkholderiales bacterium]